MGPLKLLVPLKSSEVYKVRYMQDNACSVLSLSVLVISKRGTLLKLFSGGWRIEVFDYIQVLLYTFVVFCCRVFHKNPQVLYIVLLLGVPNICLSARGRCVLYITESKLQIYPVSENIKQFLQVKPVRAFLLHCRCSGPIPAQEMHSLQKSSDEYCYLVRSEQWDAGVSKVHYSNQSIRSHADTARSVQLSRTSAIGTKLL